MAEKDNLQKVDNPEIIEEVEEQPEDPKIRTLKLIGVGATLVVIAMLASESGSVVIYVPIIITAVLFVIISTLMGKRRERKERKAAEKAAREAAQETAQEAEIVEEKESDKAE